MQPLRPDGVTFTSFTINWRGAVSSESVGFLTPFRILKSELKIIAALDFYWSTRTWQAFHRITFGDPRRRFCVGDRRAPWFYVCFVGWALLLSANCTFWCFAYTECKHIINVIVFHYRRVYKAAFECTIYSQILRFVNMY